MLKGLLGEEYATLLLLQNDGRRLQPVPRSSIAKDDYIFVGVVGRMNNKLYWLYRADDWRLWLMSEEIDPVEITDDVNASKLTFQS